MSHNSAIIGDTQVPRKSIPLNQHPDANIRTGFDNKMSVNMDEGSIYSQIGQDHQTTSAPAVNPSDPMSTIETNGTPVGKDMTKVTDASTLTIGGMEMTIANGLHTGMLQKDAQGNISLTEQGQKFHQSRTQAKAEAKERAVQEAQESMPVDPKASKVMNELTQRGGVGVHASMAEAISAMAAGDDAAYHRAVDNIQQSAGAQGVDGFVQEYSNQASGALVASMADAVGSDFDTVLAFAQSEINARELGRLVVGYGRGDRTVIDYALNQYGHKFRAWNASKRNSQ